MAQAMVESVNNFNAETICTHFQQHNASSAVLDFYDMVTELTLEQLRQRNNAKRNAK